MPVVRDLAAGDLRAVTRIYADAVEHGTATFEEVAPTLAEMTHRADAVQSRGFPFLVAKVDGTVAGYAYAAPFRERSAYRFTLEDSVYIDPAYHRQGLGRALLAELLARCEALGYRQMIAVIGDSINHASIGVHMALGFQHVGVYRSAGLKFGRWLDVVLMQRRLGDGDRSLPL